MQSPTINPSRDPRWGRNVESAGESPYVCGQYGGAYTQGLQFGVDDSVTQVVVSLKV
jgi:beta-glucosidase